MCDTFKPTVRKPSSTWSNPKPTEKSAHAGLYTPVLRKPQPDSPSMPVMIVGPTYPIRKTI